MSDLYRPGDKADRQEDTRRTSEPCRLTLDGQRAILSSVSFSATAYSWTSSDTTTIWKTAEMEEGVLDRCGQVEGHCHLPQLLVDT